MEAAPPAWVICPGYQRQDGGAQILHARDGNPTSGGDVALGVPVMESGLHALKVQVSMEDGAPDSGGDIYVGVSDAAAAFNDQDGGKSWGVRVRTGDCHVTASAHHGGFRGRSLLPWGDKRLKMAPLECVIIVDMERRTIAFGLDGARPVNAGIALPSTIRPWALTVGRRRGDTLSLSAMPVEALARYLMPTAPPKAFKRPLEAPRSPRVLAAYIKTEEARHRRVAKALAEAQAAQLDKSAKHESMPYSTPQPPPLSAPSRARPRAAALHAEGSIALPTLPNYLSQMTNQLDSAAGAVDARPVSRRCGSRGEGGQPRCGQMAQEEPGAPHTAPSTAGGRRRPGSDPSRGAAGV